MPASPASFFYIPDIKSTRGKESADRVPVDGFVSTTQLKTGLLPKEMFKSVGEASMFSDERDGYDYDEEIDDISILNGKQHKHNNQKGHNHRDNHHHSNNFEDDEQYNPFNQPSPPQLDSDDNTEQPMSWKKMHWHATRIDKVQDLVPEQVR